jgi:hypothetical protein
LTAAEFRAGKPIKVSIRAARGIAQVYAYVKGFEKTTEFVATE